MSKDKDTSVYFDREKLQFVGISSKVKKQLQATYKGVDVENELRKMGLWLTSTKGKKRVGNIGFIMNWLSNASPFGTTPSTSEELNLMESKTPLGILLQDYLREVWKGREHILELNTIKR